MQTNIPGLGPIHSSAHSIQGNRIYVYGGNDGGAAVDGLYEIDLSTLEGRRVDEGFGGPGPRQNAALHYDARSRVIYLFGGRTEGEQHRDLWRFDLERPAWTLVSDGESPKAPPRMERASLMTSPIDGTINMLAGQADEGVSDSAWRLRGGEWKTFMDLLDPEQW